VTSAGPAITQASTSITDRVLTAADGWPHEPMTADSACSIVDDLLGKLRQPLSAALGAVLVPLYVAGWRAGEHAAHHTLTVTKADDPDLDALLDDLDLDLDWSTWTPGDAHAAGIVYDDGLTRLLTAAIGQPGHGGWASRAAARGSILASIADSRLAKLGAVLAESLADGWGLGELATHLEDVLDDAEWADMVAVTETARAMTAASLATYGAHGIADKEFLTAPDDNVCELCETNAAQGAVPIGTSFAEGDPPVHPRCRCAVLPVIADGVEPADVEVDSGE
jgi:hypothetical protein